MYFKKEIIFVIHYGLFNVFFNPGPKPGGWHKGIGKCYFFLAILSALVLVVVVVAWTWLELMVFVMNTWMFILCFLKFLEYDHFGNSALVSVGTRFSCPYNHHGFT